MLNLYQVNLQGRALDLALSEKQLTVMFEEESMGSFGDSM